MPKKGTVQGLAKTKKLKESVEKPQTVPLSYAPKDGSPEADVRTYLKSRIFDLKEARKDAITPDGKSVEDIFRAADQEYTPHRLSLKTDRGKNARFETDEDGNTRYVKLGSSGTWQSREATPDLYVKVNTALAILVEKNPEAVFEPTSRKYEKNTALAEANWKQSWATSGGRKALKTGIFNMAKYGTGFWCTKPRLDIRKKRVRTEYHAEDPSKDVFEEKTIIRYNGLERFSLSPKDVWVDDTAKPGMFDAVNDWYYECEYSKEEFEALFPPEAFPNVEFCRSPNGGAGEVDGSVLMGEDTERKNDKYVVGYYENQRKDLYAVWFPGIDVLLYSSPLPNDDGMLSLWFAPWTFRSDKTIYGIGLYEIIRGDSILYDRWMNMTADQLTISIYKMFFHKGTDQLGDDGTLFIEPGKGQQVMDPNSIKWLETPGPGNEVWRGLQFIQDKRDIASGVPQQLAGKFGGKTLGQDLQAKEAALERMKLPLDFIVDALEQEAYLTLSWLNQMLSTPEILEYRTAEELVGALEEMGLSEEEIKAYMDELENPKPGQELLATEPVAPELAEDGSLVERPAKNIANVFPDVVLNMDKDVDGNLFESERRKFYRFGIDLPTKRLNWRGIVRVLPQSVLAPSKELSRRLDLDLFNLVYPSIQAMVSAPQFVPILIHPIKQIIKSFGKNAKDWLDEKSLMGLHEASKQPKDAAGDEVRPSLSLQFSDLGDLGKDGLPNKLNAPQKEILKRFYGIEVQDPLFIDERADARSTSGGLPTPPTVSSESPQPELSTASGIEAPQIADIGQAPHRMEGAVEAANRF